MVSWVFCFYFLFCRWTLGNTFILILRAVWKESFPQDLLALSLSSLHRQAICLEEYTPAAQFRLAKSPGDELIQPTTDLRVALHLKTKGVCSGSQGWSKAEPDPMSAFKFFLFHTKTLSFLSSRGWCHSDFGATRHKCHFLSSKTPKGLSPLLLWQPAGTSLSLIVILFWLHLEGFISLHLGGRQSRVH